MRITSYLNGEKLETLPLRLRPRHRERETISKCWGGGALRMMTEHHVLDLSTLGVGDLDKNSRWDDRVESQPE